MIEFHFFVLPIKSLGSLEKIRVGRVTGNIHIFFFDLSIVHIVSVVHWFISLMYVLFISCM